MNGTNSPKKSLLKRLNKPLASVKLAVFIILSMAVITAVGTFVEAKYDAYAAKKLVYGSWYMYFVMGLLTINLTAVMVDRWPWKRRHAAFVFAHIGIIILLAGSLLTFQYGLDGTMRVGIGEKNNFVQTAETDIVVYTSFDGDRYSKTFEQEVDFFLKPPTPEKPFIIPAYEGDIRIIGYEKYVIASKKVVSADNDRAGAGLRFQLVNDNVNVIEWLTQRNKDSVVTHDFGPAKVHLGPSISEGRGENEVFLTPVEGGLNYKVFQKDVKAPLKTGFVKEGDAFDPGFAMALDLRVLRFLPHAIEDWDLQMLERPTPLTSAAIKIVFEEREHWVLLNDMVKLFTDNSVYLMTFGNRRTDIGFDIHLENFEVTRYQGTMRAMAYESVVQIEGLGKQVISMNEPMKHNGLTVYQASFQEEEGRPVASIFSVNHDPGRFLKYLGSLVMSLGMVLLMWFKHLDFKLAKKSAKTKEGL